MKPYKIYRNLHRNCFSVLAYDFKKQGYRLLEHIHCALLMNVRPWVSEAGRQRVLKSQQKNVHAFILADSYIKIDKDQNDWASHNPEMYYNPYTTTSFINKETSETIVRENYIGLSKQKAYILKNN
jgi:hypothetical protein